MVWWCFPALCHWGEENALKPISDLLSSLKPVLSRHCSKTKSKKSELINTRFNHWNLVDFILVCTFYVFCMFYVMFYVCLYMFYLGCINWGQVQQIHLKSTIWQINSTPCAAFVSYFLIALLLMVTVMTQWKNTASDLHSEYNAHNRVFA